MAIHAGVSHLELGLNYAFSRPKLFRIEDSDGCLYSKARAIIENNDEWECVSANLMFVNSDGSKNLWLTELELLA